MRDISKSFITTAIVCAFLLHQCNTQYQQFHSFRNVTVRLKVSNARPAWKKIFVHSARNVNEFSAGKLPHNAKLKIISITHQKIPILYQHSISDVRARLRRIRINHCGVEELRPGFLRNLTKIFEFDLSFNEIRDVKRGTFNGTNIEKLVLNNNKIHQIDSGAFASMAGLGTIVLSHNRLVQWDPSWFSNSPVRHVDFSSNMISDLSPGSFGYFDSFKRKSYDEFFYINFNDNILTELRKNSLPRAASLWFLFLENNGIEKIEAGFFEGVEKMEALKLGRNRLTEFDNVVLGDVDIRYLKINDNLLTTIDVNITEILNIEGNPLETSCKKKWDERKKRDRELFKRYFYE